MNISQVFPQFYIDREYDTYSSREELKSLGFKWDPERKQWWHADKAERDAALEWLDETDEDYEPYRDHYADTKY